MSATTSGPSAAEIAVITKMLANVAAISATEKMGGSTIEVERKGSKIILPNGMGYKEAHIWLHRAEEAEQKTVEVSGRFDCFPLDGIIALSRAMTEVYGYTDIRQEGFWGESVPPTIIDVPTGVRTTEAAPLGKIMPPKWEGGFLEANIVGASVVVAGNVKRKFEEEARAIIAKTRDYLANSSIYRGKAFHLDLEWYDGRRKFDVYKDSPKFMETSPTNLILNPTTRFELETSIFTLIENSQICRDNGISLKHGALLAGTFGTGKTMTAKALAYMCEKNNWTFIYLKRPDQLANGLRVAKMYAPAVIFVEDIDVVVADRDEQMNDLLNTLDGVDTKNSPIITVLTTNLPEKIEPSFLRAGRIDSIIRFGLPEKDTAIEFIKLYAGKNLDPEADLAAAGEQMAGLVPAFITEAVAKAKRYAMHRLKTSDITSKVNGEDLRLAAQSVKEHMKWQNPKVCSPHERVVQQLQSVFQASMGNMPSVESTMPVGGPAVAVPAATAKK
jgi:hypothetical protein